jgi:hypothetical protein
MSNVCQDEVENLAQALEAQHGTPEERSMYVRALLRIVETSLQQTASLVGRVARAVSR